MAKVSTLAFIVGTKNETTLLNYINERISEISHFKILLTDTEPKLIERTHPDLEVQYVPSLDKEGEMELAKRAQVCAIFIMNYGVITKQLPPDRLAKICDKAWERNIFLCFSPTNFDLIISSLHSQGMPGKPGKKKFNINKAMRDILLTRFPTFDLEISDAEKDWRRKIPMWSAQQVSFWLESRQLNFLMPLFVPEKNAELATEETRYWTLGDDIKNFVKVKYASLEKSLEYLTFPPAGQVRQIMDYTVFERDYLISHHVFTTSLEFLKQLRQKYHAPIPDAVDDDKEQELRKPAAAVIIVLRDWILMEYGSDFSSNEELCTLFEEFMTNDVSKDNPEIAKELTDLLNTALALVHPYPVDLTNAPRSIVPKKTKVGKFDFLSVSHIEVARQMTLLDEQMFHKVRAKEFLGGAWTKKDAAVRAPNLTKFINHTNRMAAWVITEILRETTTARIAELITKFIQIGKELLEMRNYAGVMNILTSLHSATIGKLKNAWNLVGHREKKDFEELTESLSLLGHYKNYRETLKTLPASTPCVPLIPVTCSDLNGLGEVLENTTEDGLINWDKHQKVANHIWSVKRFMRARYIFRAVEELQKYIENAEVWEGEKTLVAVAKLRDQFGSGVPQADPMKKSAKGKEEGGKGSKDLKMSEREWNLLNTCAESSKKFGVGEIIMQRGQPNRYLYRIKKGSVRIEQLINGQNVVVLRLKEKEVELLGEMSLFSQSPTNEAIIADEPGTDIIKYKIDAVIEQCKSEPLLSEKLHRLVSRLLSDRIRALGAKKTEETNKQETNETLSGSSTISKKSKRPSVLILDKDGGGPLAETKKIAKIEKKSSGRLSTGRKGKKERNIEEEFERLFKLTNEFLRKSYNVTQKVGTAKGAKGVLYVSTNYICFHADVFGRKVKTKFGFSAIKDLQLNGNKIELTTANTQIVIKNFENIVEAFTFLTNFLEQSKQNKENTTEDYAEDEKTEEGDDHSNLAPSDNEWNLILEGTRSIHFQKNEYVIVQSKSQPQRLYQIAKGSCRIEMELDGKTNTFGMTTKDSMFGEISFLEGVGGKATASVVADEAETVVRVIEGYYLNILFEYFPGLSGRFYHYLGQVLSKRLKMRVETAAQNNKKEEDESEVDDERSETDNRKESSLEHSDKDSKKNPVKRTKDLDKKVKKRRKSSNRIVVEGKPAGKEEEEKEKKK